MSTVLETRWSKSTVPLEALERALYSLADRATGSIRDEEDYWVLELRARSESVEEASLAHALRQEVNDQALRVRIATRTDPIRNLIFAVAFSRSGLVEAPAE